MGEHGAGSRKMKPVPDRNDPDISSARRLLPALPGNIQPEGFAFYAVVLPGLSASSMYQFIAYHWIALDKLTGEHTVLVAPVIPSVITHDYVEWWHERLTEEQFALFITKLRSGLQPEAYNAAELDAYRLAQDLGIQRSDLPVMVVAPSLTDTGTNDIIVPLDRKWDDSTIGKFFELFADACARNSGESDAHQRLLRLSDDLDDALALCRPSATPVSVERASLGIRLVSKGAWALVTSILPLVFKAVTGQ